MMGNMFEMRQNLHAQKAEEEMLQKALEESRQTAGVQNLNPDEMTYEQLLQLEEENGGKVATGLKKIEIARIPQITWRFKNDTSKGLDQCSVCMDNFKYGDKVKELKKCKHAYHTKCIDQWLESENKCPICKQHIWALTATPILNNHQKSMFWRDWVLNHNLFLDQWKNGAVNTSVEYIKI